MTDFETVHARLREILMRHRAGLAVTRDVPGGVAVEFPGFRAAAEEVAAARR
jgi:hypothetical protein